jgi:uncharacterized protein (DUF488 family)
VTATIYTVGHSTRPIEELLSVLQAATVSLLVDVRTVPRSKRHPQFDGGLLAESLSGQGITYWHERALGGFRRPKPGSPNTGWQNSAFRGYADHMASPEFAEALQRLEAMASEQPTCIMCAEAQWRRCHRRLIADAMTVRKWRVVHLGLGEPIEHELTPLAVVGRDGSLTYPPFQGELDLS